jgi:hypothetical protein
MTCILISPKNTKLQIFTDSAAAIQGINKCKTLKTHLQLRKTNNYNIIKNIIDLEHKLHIRLTITKIKGHSGIEGNEIADKLAKKAWTENANTNTSLTSQILHRNTEIILPRWDKTPLEKPLNQAIKTSYHLVQSTKWALLNRNRKWIDHSLAKKIAWIPTFKTLHPTKITSPLTNLEDHNERIFNLKIWNDELPTKAKLHKRSPNIYTDNKCIECGEEENSIHPFICRKNNTNWTEIITNTLAKEISSRINKKQKTNLKQQIEKECLLNFEHITKLIVRGVIFHNMINFINKLTNNKEKTNQIIANTYKTIKQNCKQIWNEKCDKFIEWEKIKKITRKVKRSKQYKNNPTNSKDLEIKDQYPKIVNAAMETYIKGKNTLEQILSLFPLVFSASGALAR